MPIVEIFNGLPIIEGEPTKIEKELAEICREHYYEDKPYIKSIRKEYKRFSEYIHGDKDMDKLIAGSKWEGGLYIDIAIGLIKYFKEESVALKQLLKKYEQE